MGQSLAVSRQPLRYLFAGASIFVPFRLLLLLLRTQIERETICDRQSAAELAYPFFISSGGLAAHVYSVCERVA